MGTYTITNEEFRDSRNRESLRDILKSEVEKKMRERPRLDSTNLRNGITRICQKLTKNKKRATA